MTVQEVILKALSGEMHWFRAADILGFSPRTLRRWRERYEKHGYIGLVDKRRQSPSVRRVAAPEVERLNRPFEDRLVSELRVATVTTLHRREWVPPRRLHSRLHATFSCPRQIPPTRS